MIPVTLTLRNFLSYGEQPQSLDFTGFRVACLSAARGMPWSGLNLPPIIGLVSERRTLVGVGVRVGFGAGVVVSYSISG